MKYADIFKRDISNSLIKANVEYTDILVSTSLIGTGYILGVDKLDIPTVIEHLQIGGLVDTDIEYNVLDTGKSIITFKILPEDRLEVLLDTEFLYHFTDETLATLYRVADKASLISGVRVSSVLMHDDIIEFRFNIAAPWSNVVLLAKKLGYHFSNRPKLRRYKRPGKIVHTEDLFSNSKHDGKLYLVLNNDTRFIVPPALKFSIICNKNELGFLEDLLEIPKSVRLD